MTTGLQPEPSPRTGRAKTNGHPQASSPTPLWEAAPRARFANEILVLETTDAPSFHDITELVAEVVRRSGIENGQVLVFSRHTTAAVRLQEAEPLLLEDIAACLERLAPRDLAYRHNDFDVRTVNMHPDESPNGHSHCRHLFLGASETMPLVDGELGLGPWQRIFLIELDRPRQREVHVQVLGY